VSRTAARGLFVTGTDTGVGKTVVSVALLRALGNARLRAVGMKPVAAGIDEGERENADVAALAAASTIEAPREAVNPYAFRPAIAPHVAARMAGVRIDLAVLQAAYARLAALADAVVVEGAGGALVPLDERLDMLDIACACGLPVLLVVGVRLGCINHALLSAQAIRARGLVLAGWIATRIDPAMACAGDSVQAIAARVGAPLLGDFASAAAVAFDAGVLARLALAHARAAPGPRIDPC
jgi:dethiobiotin synthetase